MKNGNIFDSLIQYIKYKYSKKINFFLNRYNKIHIIILFFIFIFLIVIWKMFSYTVLDYKFYKNLADKQQIWNIIVPVTRWTIYSLWQTKTISAISINLYDISIDPKSIWDKDKLSYFLTDLIYKEICFLKSKNKCKKNLFRYLRVFELKDYSGWEVFIKKLILEKISKKVSSKKVTSIFLNHELDLDQTKYILNMWLIWIYIKWNFLYANPEEINNLWFVSEKLNNILPYTKEELKKLLRKRDIRYIPILKRVSITTSEYLKEYIKNEKISIRKWILNKKDSINSFFILSPKPNRFYTENQVWASIIWFVDKSWKWNYWIEWYFNDILKWNNWRIISRKDILWRIIDPISLSKENIIWEWISLVTTIDRNIQKKVEEILEIWVKKYWANKWTIVIMNPKTWKVISLANYPSYDLNNYSDVYELEKVRYSKYPDPKIDLLWYPVFVEDKINGEKFIYNNKEIFLKNASKEDLWNIAIIKYKYKNNFWAQVYKNDSISSLYEPGSIMKWLTVAIWFDTEEINSTSFYNDIWKVSIDNFTIKNDSDKCLWFHDFSYALNFSCNIWMVRIAQKVWKTLFYQYFNDFWFWNITWIDLSWEVFSKIKPWEKWSKAKLLTSSYWLWISVTPIQMAIAYSALVNWWVIMKPQIIEEIIFPNGSKFIYKSEQVRRVIKKSTSDLISKMLVDSINKWVARNWAVEWYSVWWKTWTSQIPYRWKYEEWVWSTIASYAWFWPAEDPQFVIIVKLDRPRQNQYWGRTAAFIFKDVASYLFDYYWIPRKQ